MTSSIARTVQGISKENQAQVQGLGGLDRLCRVYGSAEYLEKKMRDWSDDVFFLELWDELQYRAKKNTLDGGKTLTGNMTIADVAVRTSQGIGSDEDSGGLFDETANSYRRLRIRIEEIIQETLSYSSRESLRPYSRINPWASLPSTSTPASTADLTPLSITTELDPLVQLLSTHLSFLHKALASAPLRRIVRHVCLSIQSYIWDTILLRNSFSTTGIAQFQRDLSALHDVIDRYVGAGQARLGMRKLYEAVRLLGLPIKARREVEEDGGGEGDGEGMGIWEVEERVFRSNESAREVLDELGFEALVESEARSVLEKRVEIAS